MNHTVTTRPTPNTQVTKDLKTWMAVKPIWLMGMMVLTSFLINYWQVDLKLAAWFHDDEAGWWLASNPLIQGLYHYGEFPAWIATVVILALAFIPLAGPCRPHWRPMGVYLILVLLLGPGLLINGIFKEHFGRPRPNQIRTFGGKLEFKPLGQPGVAHVGKSFPSGHASMGFFWLALFIYLRRSNPKLAKTFLLLGLIHGGAMGFGRMAQGKHFLGDVLWSGAMVYLVSWANMVSIVPALQRRWAISEGEDPIALMNHPKASTEKVAPQVGSEEFSVVVPCYNEEASIQFVMDELLEKLPEAEIIMVDDGSTDGTWALIQSYAPRIRGVRLTRNLGQSGALYIGFQYATRPLCGLMDGDGQNDPADFYSLRESLVEHGADMTGGIRAKRQDDWVRRLASRLANRIRNRWLGDSSRDTGCSLKLFRSEHRRLLVPFNGLHRFLPTFFQRAGLHFVEIPVNHRPRKGGISKYSIGGRAWRGIYDLVGVGWLMKRRVIPTEVITT